jgi:Family of unknown function (DUF6326)
LKRKRDATFRVVFFDVAGSRPVSGDKRGMTVLDDVKIPVRIKLSALWASVMFCYIYGDYFGLYKPGALQSMLDGRMGPLGPTTQGVLLGTTLMMAIPSAMVFLSLVLRAGVCRWANIVLGLVYTAIMLLTMPGAWAFYLVLGVIEIVLTLLILRYAWTWPKHPAG